MKTIKAADLPAYLRGSRTKGRSRIRVAPKAERTRDGHVFASKAEAEFYEELRLEQHAAKARGEYFLIVLQPKFLLAGVVFTSDFLVVVGENPVFPGDHVRVYEVKGKRKTDTLRQRLHRAEHLRAFRRSARQLKELHGVEVQLVER